MLACDEFAALVTSVVLVLCLSGLLEPGHFYAVNILTGLVSVV